MPGTALPQNKKMNFASWLRGQPGALRDTGAAHMGGV